MKNSIAKLLKKVSNSMLVTSTASAGGWGVEEMPESMKKNR